jgi:cobalt-zinc-cadmium resistance protein CzcA
VGGDVIEKNGQAYVVRGIGLVKSVADIGNITIQNDSGNPVLVKNVAEVHESSMPRVGQAALNHHDDTVEGIVVMRKGKIQEKF